MNARVLELLQRPENISKEDISLLQNEISKFPYMQSIRTLHLSAIFNFDAENYQKELTKTAAYTTDKKILYTFINKKNEEEKKELTKFKKIVLAKAENEVEKTVEEPVNIVEVPEQNITENPSENLTETVEKIEAEKPVITHPKSIVGDTELEAPILDKKENEFEVLKELEILEIENQLLEQEKAEEENAEIAFKTREEDLNFSKETVLEHIDKSDDKEITSVKPSDISFNGFESFLPNVKFTVPPVQKEEPKSEPKAEIPAPIIKEKQTEEKIKSEEVSSEKTPEVNISAPEKTEIIEEKIEMKIEKEEPQDINTPILTEEKEEIVEEIHTDWKPMNFVMNPLDSMIQKSAVSQPKATEKPVEVKPEIAITEEKKIVEEVAPIELKKEVLEEAEIEEKAVEKSILNTSFLKNNIQEVSVQTVENQPKEAEKEENNSNIPDFVNTWQSWLKIDRTSVKTPENIPVKVIEKKAEIIDKFIEENPKISQLKEEVSFVVKEKNDDISHLMTETLAKLYTEQRLYTKAIKAYEILQNKHPEKAEDFKAKIQEIKYLKQGK
ncbi:hypothetical protein [Cloacibacterium sp. TD35]|uniref:hypothetical protein n=1 Tax=Cloacibacterium sp. TD35 TaxID=2976818 RepID=UPI00237E3C3F|nr:hypothetical protein [Cloacibacterium sp. TD35]WDT68475.1 hypothetical protein N7277_02420 [Cloacibacterium sp. TD35]